MEEWLAVGVVVLGAFGLAHDAKHKTAIAAAQRQHVKLRARAAAAQAKKYRGRWCRRPHRSIISHCIPQARL